MITREQVADLRPGDVVELSIPSAKVTGELRHHVGEGLSIAPSLVVRRADGELSGQWIGWALTVVSRAPRPLYVNHHRTEPVAGDVARDEEADGVRLLFRIATNEERRHSTWLDQDWIERTYDHLPARLCLLVDGETGQVVP